MNFVFIGMDLRSGVRCACLVLLPSSWHQCRRGVRNDVGATLAPFRDAAEGRFVWAHRSPGCWRRVMYAGGAARGTAHTAGEAVGNLEGVVSGRAEYGLDALVDTRRFFSCFSRRLAPACVPRSVSGVQREGAQNTVRTKVVSECVLRDAVFDRCCSVLFRL